MDIIEALIGDSLLPLIFRRGNCGSTGINREERSPLAKAAAGLPAAVGKTTRGFESLPSPPLSRKRSLLILAWLISTSQAIFSVGRLKVPGSCPSWVIYQVGRPRLKEAIC